MSDAIPLPERPNLDQYKKLARELQRACKSGGEDAVVEWAARWKEAVNPEVARRLWREMQPKCTLTAAQFFLARGHGFASWPKFAAHVEAVAQRNSPAWKFETVADAIVTGDLPALQKLLSEDAALIRARSGRDHRSTLLHYISANGVEDFRQKTPPNIVEITRTLLDAGADINAESDAYGGRSTTVDLTATSYHPQAAGVQIPLLALLLDRGARVDGRSVVACLQNGRGAAAEFLAAHCTSLDLEGAAGVGRVDIVDALFDSSTETQRTNGLAWACEFGRPAVAETLLRRGVPVAATLPHHGQTGLHWAAYGGHAPVVGILLRHGAPVNSLDASFGGTPLQWALYGWGSAATPSGTGDYYDAVAVLAKAGAKLDTVWFEGDDNERRRAIAKLRADPRMLAALDGR
ncbi:MAG TPA: ankyrin repeat domain-containing protein [Candidatus Limnocylindrales bacterium]|nr:ankyrin repeat domain-containing protein [Candidatus Limnocylindrales bacterium]